MSRARDLADGTFSGAFSADSPTLVVDDTNNRVGVGTASPGEPLDVSGNIRALGANSRVLFGPDGFEAGIKYATNAALQIASRTGEPITFTNGHDGTEIARIVTGGAFYIGETTAISSGDGQRINLTSGSTGNYIRFKWAGSEVGSITLNGAGVAYNTSSDYRLKENVTELTGAIDRVKQVPVHRFNFISNPDKTVDGFLAHEVADVVPEAITGTKDEVDEEGSPVYQGIDQSKLVPLLTAAIKEQQALIEDLQTRLTALEAV
jgi:hypothetical protein